MPTNDVPRTVQAVQTTLDIIEALRKQDEAGITELAAELDRSKGTIHSHLATLLENEYVRKEDDMYRLSLRYLELGEAVKGQLKGYESIQDEVDDLANQTGELAQFATMEHGQAVYLYKASGENSVQTASSTGKREYLHAISLGKAMLAYMPDTKVEAIVNEHGMPSYTDQTITSYEALQHELERIREDGYAFDEEEKIEGIRCVAAPVQADGGILGAVSVSGPSKRMEGELYRDELPNQVIRSANVIEINTKFA